MKKIHLSKNYYAIVDDEDFDILNKYKWHLHKRKTVNYARTTITIKFKKYLKIQMHRLILNAPDYLQVDHINHDGLDNRKLNLRLCTPSENSRNQRGKNGYTNKYKGVYWIPKINKWYSIISNNGKQVFLGAFEKEFDAAKAYNNAALIYHKEFAYLNKV